MLGVWKRGMIRRFSKRGDDFRHQPENTSQSSLVEKKLHEINDNIDDIHIIFDGIPEDDKKQVAGQYLHNLSKNQPTVDDVKKVIAAYPEALLYENESGAVPIQAAALYVHTKQYIPLLAIEASQRNIGLRKGGLLLPSIKNTRKNILQSLVNGYSDKRPAWHENICLEALKDLYSEGLLLEQDIIQMNLMKWASGKNSILRLNYLLEIHPKVLASYLPNGNFPIHPTNHVGDEKDIGVFARLLKAGMEYDPHQFGFLFRRNRNGESAIEQAIDAFGRNEVFRIVQALIPSINDYPILHFVFRYVPRLCDDFIGMYPESLYLKDMQGRHLLHVAVKYGARSPSCLLMMIHSSKGCIEETDPVTNLYPFMLAAASTGRKKDLTTIYRLLSLRPDIISTCLNDA